MHLPHSIAIYLKTQVYKVMQRQYSSKMHNTFIIVATLFKTLCHNRKFCQNWLTFIEDMTKKFWHIFTVTQHWNLTKHGV